MADPNIFAQYLKPVRSVADYQADADAQDLRQQQLIGAQRQNALAALTAQQTQAQLADAADKRNALQAIYQRLGPNSKPDDMEAALMSDPRFMEQGIALQKHRVDVEKTRSEAQAKTAESLAKAMQIQGQLAQQVLANPTREVAMAAVDAMERTAQHLGLPMRFEQTRAQIMAAQSPEELKRWAGASALSAKELLPHIQNFGAGDRQVTQAVDPVTGQVREVNSTPIGVSANTRETQAGEDRRQGLRLAQEKDLAGQAVTYQQDGNGNIVALPSKVAPGTMVRASQVAAPGAGLQPLQGKDAGMNEGQANALAFASRMKASHDILTSLDGKYSPAAVNTTQGLESVYGLGGVLGGGANMALSDEGQRASQAQRDFINAILRRESGAAISASEFANANKQYFPQAGDSKAVIEQKRQSRERAIAGMLEAVPKNNRKSFDTLSRTDAPDASSANVVTSPDGKVHTFPTPEAAAAFRKAAGL